MKTVIPAAVAALLLSGSPALAQSFQPRAYVAGMSGVTFGTERDATFGGEFGANVTDHVQVYGHVSRMRNTLPTYVNTELELLSEEMSQETGLPWSFQAKAPAWLGVGGLRLSVPTRGIARPYMLGGFGFGRVNMKVTEVDLGDVTDTLIQSGFITTEDLRMTKALVELGGGVQFPVGHLYFDGGYRFSKLLDADDFNTSRAYFGIGARF
jgi:opacity protein-like surface antigen